mgnify:FL=1
MFIRKWLSVVGASVFPRQPHGIGSGNLMMYQVTIEKMKNQVAITNGKIFPAKTIAKRPDENSHKPII